MNLRKKQNLVTDGALLVDTEELRIITNLGRNAAMELGVKAKAKIKIGRRVLWSRAKIEKYIRELEEE